MKAVKMATERSEEKLKVNWWIWAPIGIFLVFMLIGISESNTPEGKERSSQRSVIELCWKEQGRKSLDPSAARLAASYCEKMEDDYRKQWHANP